MRPRAVDLLRAVAARDARSACSGITCPHPAEFVSAIGPGGSTVTDASSKGIAVNPELRSYLLAHSVTLPPANAELVDATRKAMGDLAIMQIAEEQGPFLTWTARLLGARRAIEVGSFTGLSAMCIAEGLGDGGRLTCFDVNPGFVDVGRPHWERAGVAERIDVVIGPAADPRVETVLVNIGDGLLLAQRL